MSVDDALEFLGLEAGATREEIKHAYRDLVKVWHPDRFPERSSVRAKAEARLKEINEAYALLQRDGTTARARRSEQSAESSHANSSQKGETQASQDPPQDAPSQATGVVPAWVYLVASLAAVWLIGVVAELRRGAGIQNRRPLESAPQVSQMPDESLGVRDRAISPANPTAAVGRRHLVRRGETLRQIASEYHVSPVELGLSNGLGPGHPLRRGMVLIVPARDPADLQAEERDSSALLDELPRKPTDIFTVGSPKDQVLIAQGTPTEFSDEIWKYGLSAVYFRDGHVVSWDIYPGFPLNARMVSAPGAGRPLFFTIGATKDEVLLSQGTPTSFNDDAWKYGLSMVYFSGGHVVSWDIYPGYPVKARLMPSVPGARRLPYFTVGSTKDEVLLTQGSPTNFNDDVWKYGLSAVYFREGRVVSWNIYSGFPIRARLVPSSETNP